jgi:FKBP-type peptidyl-prolyl cis-trans isomerase
MYVVKENDEIDQYIVRHKWTMIKTGTGLRYMITKQGSGELAKPKQMAKVNYRISLLDGTECYTSDKTGPREFMIAQDDIESGLHEGIQYLHVGDKAFFILPSYLAHGLVGDENKIPAKASVVYEIELLSLK